MLVGGNFGMDINEEDKDGWTPLKQAKHNGHNDIVAFLESICTLGCTYSPSLHFLCSKFSIFLTTYPPLNANVICEGSLSCKGRDVSILC